MHDGATRPQSRGTTEDIDAIVISDSIFGLRKNGERPKSPRRSKTSVVVVTDVGRNAGYESNIPS